jgi:hypothetical protein
MAETSRGLPYPAPDSKIDVAGDIKELALQTDSVFDDEASARVAADTAVGESAREYAKHEAQEALSDAKEYADGQIDALPIPEDTSHLPVLGPWAVSASQTNAPPLGVISADSTPTGTGASTYGDMQNWNLLVVSLLDSTYHGGHRWENLQPDWLITYTGSIHSATWKATSVATRNGDQSLSVNIEWVDGTTTDPADLGGDGYVHAHEETAPHFPIRGGI